MRAMLIVICLLLLCGLLVINTPLYAAYAATPTPRLYPASELYTRIAPKQIAISTLPGDWSSITQAGPTVVADSGGWFNTLWDMLEQSNAMAYIFGFAVLVGLVAGIGYLINWLMNRP